MAVALAALIILTILLKGMRKRRLKGMQAGLESQYNEIKASRSHSSLTRQWRCPVSMRTCSARSMSAARPLMPCRRRSKECGVLLAEAEDLLFVRKNKAAARKMETLRTNLEQCRKDADHVNQVLDEILEQESEQRAQINVLKEKFPRHPQSCFRKTGRPIIRAMNISKSALLMWKRNFLCLRNGCSLPSSIRRMSS